MMQFALLPLQSAGSGREILLSLLGMEERGGVAYPVSPGSLGLVFLVALDFVAERCRLLADANQALGLVWDRHMRCTYISKCWYQRVLSVASNHPGLDFWNCHGQRMIVVGGAFSVLIKWVNSRGFSSRNETVHAAEILSQEHHTGGFGELRYWELGYEITPSGYLRNIRLQYRVGMRILDRIFLGDLSGGRYEVPGGSIPVIGGSGETADTLFGKQDTYDF